MVNRLFIFFALLSFLSLSSFAAPRPFIVVIDPGHGGNDYGTIYDNGRVKLAEKDVTLILAREAAKKLRAQGIRTILTRNEDRDVPLASRTAFANKVQADVFISLHMNSTATPMVSDAQGIETYILNNTTDASSRRLAHFENSVVGGSPNLPDQLDVALILKDLRLDANLSESKRLACAVQSNLVLGTTPSPLSRLRNRGVKQALFYILLGADMPSALVEVGFLTSPRDRALVMSVKGQKRIAEAIATAISHYSRSKGTRRALLDLASCKVN